MTTNIMTTGQTMDQLYLDRDETGDVTFLVESQRICAHRMILAAHSPRYKAQFYGKHADLNEIFIPNVSAAAFKVFLQLFYKETIGLTMENIRMVLDLAKQSLVEEFVESCANFLKESITVKNLFDLYGLSILYDIESLRLSCEEQISKNTLNVFASDDFLRCNRDVLVQILKMDTLNCSEADIFRACIAWARTQCNQINLVQHPENLRAALRDAIYQIRFSSITAEEFADMEKSMRDFFTPDESIEISQIINKLDDFKPQKFNGTDEQRLKAYHQTPSWLLQCNRYTHRNSWSTDLPRCIREVGCFNFYCSCSKPIRLHGISFDFHFDDDDLDNFPHTISIAIRRDGDESLISFETNYKIYQNPKRNDETVVMFDKPIENIIYFSCSLRLPRSRFIFGPRLKSFVQVYDTKFSLCGDSVSRFYYDVMVKNDVFFYDYGPFLRSTEKFKIPIYNWSPIFIEKTAVDLDRRFPA